MEDDRRFVNKEKLKGCAEKKGEVAHGRSRTWHVGGNIEHEKEEVR